MTQYVEDLRIALAEVAPELASLVNEPSGRFEWANAAIRYGLSWPEYELIQRAFALVRRKHGLTRSYCVECGWQMYCRRDRVGKDDLVRNGCEHIQ